MLSFQWCRYAHVVLDMGGFLIPMSHLLEIFHNQRVKNMNRTDYALTASQPCSYKSQNLNIISCSYQSF